MKDILINKIEELIKFSASINEPNSQIVLLALSGSLRSNQDGLLAAKTQEFVKDVLLPNVQEIRGSLN